MKDREGQRATAEEKMAANVEFFFDFFRTGVVEESMRCLDGEHFAKLLAKIKEYCEKRLERLERRG